MSDAAERMYADLGSAFTGPDESLGWPLLLLVDAFAIGEWPGWDVLLDVDQVPAAHLPWLAQWVGVRVPRGLDAASGRLLIKEGRRAGTVASIRAAARAHLTGNRTVEIIERDGSAYRMRVRTYAVETPDPAKVEAALMRAKPAPDVLIYEVYSGAPYDQLDAEFGTYADQDAALATYADQTAHVPA